MNIFNKYNLFLLIIIFSIIVSVTTAQTISDNDNLTSTRYIHNSITNIELGLSESININKYITTDRMGNDLIFTSYNPQIASIDKSGYMQGLAIGTTKIRVSNKNLNEYIDFVVNVHNYSPITGISIPIKEITIGVYEEAQLAANFLPIDRPIPEGGEVSWACDNHEVALVEPNGHIIGKEEGVAHAVCTYIQDYNIINRDTIKINVYLGIIPVTDVKFFRDNISINKGSSNTITVKVVPDKATNRNITVTSSNPEIVTVSKIQLIGSEDTYRLNGVSTGKTTISAVSEDGEYASSINVNVEGSSSRGGGFLAEGVTTDNGWFDCNKEWGSRDNATIGNVTTDYLSKDNSMCWAATIANLVDWWQASIGYENIPANTPFGFTKDKDNNLKPNDNTSYSQSNVYEYIRLYSSNSGFFVSNGLNWFFTGSQSLEFEKNWEKGFRYKDYVGFDQNRFVSSDIHLFIDKGREFYIAELKKALEKNLKDGSPMGLNISFLGGYGHAITLWGYELGDNDIADLEECPNLNIENNKVTKDNLESHNGDNLIAYLYITDSDDGYSPNRNANVRPMSLVRVPVFYRDSGVYIITAQNKCNVFGRIVSLSPFYLKYGEIPILK